VVGVVESVVVERVSFDWWGWDCGVGVGLSELVVFFSVGDGDV